MRVFGSVETSAANMRASDAKMGEKAARLIWEDASSLDEIHDPRTGEFAAAVIDGLAAALASSPGAIKKMMLGAAAAPVNSSALVPENTPLPCAASMAPPSRCTPATR